MTMSQFSIETPTVIKKDDGVYEAEYVYRTMKSYKKADGTLSVTPEEKKYVFRTDSKVPKLGVMIVGLGGNNGSTLTASLIANRLKLRWKTKRGEQKANYFGSMVLSSTVQMGFDSETMEPNYVPVSQLAPFVDPNEIEIGGWDINGADLAMAMERAQVLEPTLQKQVYEEMKKIEPLASIYDADFIASNQKERANNVIEGTRQQQLEKIRKDIREFKQKKKVDQVIVLWSANTERYSKVEEGIHDTAENVLAAIRKNYSEISPSLIFGVAAILEKCPYVNGSPQNTCVPGLIDLAEKNGIPIAGDDFKTGQTKLKSVLVDFLVGSGIKPLAITSYNHLGNNDGLNLSSAPQFSSKEISKKNVVDDVVASNSILYSPGEHPDHVIVIKYVPNVGDSKRALDEYESEIFMGGRSTISIHNTCEDSLLAAPVMLDLCLLMELFMRVSYAVEDGTGFKPFHPVMSILAFLLKAPVVPPQTPIVNAFYKQRAAIENILKALIGLPPQNDMLLEQKAP